MPQDILEATEYLLNPCTKAASRDHKQISTYPDPLLSSREAASTSRPSSFSADAARVVRSWQQDSSNVVSRHQVSFSNSFKASSKSLQSESSGSVVRSLESGRGRPGGSAISRLERVVRVFASLIVQCDAGDGECEFSPLGPEPGLWRCLDQPNFAQGSAISIS